MIVICRRSAGAEGTASIIGMHMAGAMGPATNHQAITDNSKNKPIVHLCANSALRVDESHVAE